tara:strand:- start:7724 stop:7849 length:126 start_codon:yes stop_codon:yes gene_type:complete
MDATTRNFGEREREREREREKEIEAKIEAATGEKDIVTVRI